MSKSYFIKAHWLDIWHMIRVSGCWITSVYNCYSSIGHYWDQSSVLKSNINFTFTPYKFSTSSTIKNTIPCVPFSPVLKGTQGMVFLIVEEVENLTVTGVQTC